MGSIIAWITGNARDSSVMKEKIKDGYDGKYSDYINKYDELASFHYEKFPTNSSRESTAKVRRSLMLDVEREFFPLLL